MPSKIDIPPTTIETGPRGGGGSEWVTLIRARHDIDAHLLTGRLGESGIETRSVKDKGHPGAWLYGGSNPWAPVMILVRRLQLEEARIVLAEISYAGPSVTELEERFHARKASFPVVWWVTALILGILLTVLVVGQATRAWGMCQLPIFCEEGQ